MPQSATEDVAKLQAELHRLEGEIVAAKVRLYSRRENSPEPPKRLGWMLWGYFLAFVLGSSIIGACLLRGWDGARMSEFGLAVTAGVLGAALSGLISLNERVAYGWEFEDGTREPDPAEKKERFNRRLAGGFLARPFLGIVAGVLVLAGGRFGHFISAQDEYGVLFLALLGGLFSKTLFDRLKDAFKKVLGK